MTDPVTLQAQLDAQSDIIRAQEAEIAQLKDSLDKSEYKVRDFEVLLKNEAVNYHREAEDSARLRLEIAQLSRGLRITREQLEDALIELDGYRSKPTTPAPPLAPYSCVPAVESRGELGT